MTPTLSWQQASDATGYDLEISTSSDFTNRDAIVNEKTNLRVVGKVTGITTIDEYQHIVESNVLDYNTTGYWRVRTTNPDLKGEWTTTSWSFTTTIAKVTLISPENEDTSIPLNPVFTWNAVSGARNYEFQVAGDASFDTRLFQLSTVAPFFDLSGGSLTFNNTTMFLRVRVKNDAGNITWLLAVGEKAYPPIR